MLLRKYCYSTTARPARKLEASSAIAANDFESLYDLWEYSPKNELKYRENSRLEDIWFLLVPLLPFSKSIQWWSTSRSVPDFLNRASSDGFDTWLDHPLVIAVGMMMMMMTWQSPIHHPAISKRRNLMPISLLWHRVLGRSMLLMMLKAMYRKNRQRKRNKSASALALRAW